MRKRELPEWARKMTDEEWEAHKKHVDNELGPLGPYRNCVVCNKRLIISLCKYNENKFYCVEHCPKHKWQSDYDWTKECAKCGIWYTEYLQMLLDLHKIKYDVP